MKALLPEKMLKQTKAFEKSIKIALKKEIAVGLPKAASLTKKVYQSSKMTVLDVGIVHEFGLGNNPVRSFLRVPFAKKKAEISNAMSISFSKVEQGANVIQQMERTGAFIQNISKAAFNNRGYGSWPPLNQKTIERKGTSTILTDTGTLKQSITYEVRNATA